jgi:hypothetical protein
MKRSTKPKYIVLAVALVAVAACASSGWTPPDETGTRVTSRSSVFHDGPQIAATVVHPSAERSVGEEWLVLAVELTAQQGSGPFVVRRSDITLRTPDGRRLTVLSQDEFRGTYPRFQIPVERALSYLPLLDRYKPGRDVPCNRWFLAPPPGMLTFDEIPISSSQICSGPLAFEVPGGAQPGRWRLIIELEESRADIPFLLELRN